MYATYFWEGKKKTFVILLCTSILFTEATHAFGPRLDMKQHLVGISAWGHFSRVMSSTWVSPPPSVRTELKHGEATLPAKWKTRRALQITAEEKKEEVNKRQGRLQGCRENQVYQYRVDKQDEDKNHWRINTSAKDILSLLSDVIFGLLGKLLILSCTSRSKLIRYPSMYNHAVCQG